MRGRHHLLSSAFFVCFWRGRDVNPRRIDRFCALLHGTDDVGEVRVEGHKCSKYRAIVSAVPFSLSYVIEIWTMKKGHRVILTFEPFFFLPGDDGKKKKQRCHEFSWAAYPRCHSLCRCPQRANATYCSIFVTFCSDKRRGGGPAWGRGFLHVDLDKR